MCGLVLPPRGRPAGPLADWIRQPSGSSAPRGIRTTDARSAIEAVAQARPSGPDHLGPGPRRRDRACFSSMLGTPLLSPTETPQAPNGRPTSSPPPPARPTPLGLWPGGRHCPAGRRRARGARRFRGGSGVKSLRSWTVPLGGRRLSAWSRPTAEVLIDRSDGLDLGKKPSPARFAAVKDPSPPTFAPARTRRPLPPWSSLLGGACTIWAARRPARTNRSTWPGADADLLGTKAIAVPAVSPAWSIRPSSPTTRLWGLVWPIRPGRQAGDHLEQWLSHQAGLSGFPDEMDQPSGSTGLHLRTQAPWAALPPCTAPGSRTLLRPTWPASGFAAWRGAASMGVALPPRIGPDRSASTVDRPVRSEVAASQSCSGRTRLPIFGTTTSHSCAFLTPWSHPAPRHASGCGSMEIPPNGHGHGRQPGCGWMAPADVPVLEGRGHRLRRL